MSKALYGHLVSPDPRLLAEVSRLRARIADLQSENDDLRARLLIETATPDPRDLDDVDLGDIVLDAPHAAGRPAPALA